MIQAVTRWFRRLPTLSARFHVAFGLSSLVTSLTLASVFAGLVPDRQDAVIEARLHLAEAIASSTSLMLRRNDMPGIRQSIEHVIARNEALNWVELRRGNDGSTVLFGRHDDVPDAGLSTDGPIQVPLVKSGRSWGEMRFGFKTTPQTGLSHYLPSAPFGLLLFMGLLSLPLFYVYLGRMLKELDPSAAIPGRVRSALDTIAECLLVIDRHGNVVLANEAFAQLVGRTPEAMIGAQASTLAWEHEDDAQPIHPWRQTLQTGEPTRHDMLTFRDAEGARRSFIVNCSPVAASKGRVGGVLMSMDDVTLLEEKEVQLRQSMQLAEEANRAKSDFLSTMSHEIRTPMTAILGFTEVLRRGAAGSNEERQRHLNTIARSGEHLLELINGLLDLSKVESGALELEHIETQPVQLVQDVVDVMAVKAIEKGIALTTDLPDTVPAYILSDPARLRQIVTNLLGNAIKFTETGSVTVRLRFDTGSNRMICAVEDTGIGMSQQQQDTVFDAFTQADVSITRRFGGTGLGLSICRQLSRALGGDVSVTSIFGQGSTFEVVLPTGPLDGVPMTSLQDLQAMPSISRMASSRDRQFPGASVLVVDDAEENRELLSLVLADLGVMICTASNGQEAIERVETERFDVVLMDIQMPVMDGYEAVGILRARGYEVPVIALTANAMKGHETRIFDAGFSHYHTKPIDVDALMTLMAELLSTEARAEAPVDMRRQPVGEGDVTKEQPGLSQEAEEADRPVVSTMIDVHPKFAALVGRFVIRLMDELDGIHASVQSDDMDAIARFAHWLKGSGGNMGFDHFVAMARQLERAALDGKTDLVKTQLDEIIAYSRRVKAGWETLDSTDRAA